MTKFLPLVLAMLFANAAFAGDAVEKALKEREGKTATVILRSGAELTGTVAKVGDGAVKLTELSGKEFYDAIVDLDGIQAVLLKARSQ